MRPLIEIRGRMLTDSDIELIRTSVDKNKHKNRCYISRLLAREWQWYQPDGRLKDRACRDILAFLERHGVITLPAPAHRRKQVSNESEQLKINFDFDFNAIEYKLGVCCMEA